MDKNKIREARETVSEQLDKMRELIYALPTPDQITETFEICYFRHLDGACYDDCLYCKWELEEDSRKYGEEMRKKYPDNKKDDINFVEV